MKFMETVAVYTDVYAYDVFSLVVELGSALGLWLGFSALSMFDSITSIISMVNLKKICKF